MSSPTAPKLIELPQKMIHTHLSLPALCKSLAITSGIVIFLFYTFFHHPLNYKQSSNLLPSNPSKLQLPAATTATAATNISHIVFGLVGSMNTWGQKKLYVESWWRPNVTRGYVFLDRPPTEEFTPWPPSLPPFRVSEDISNWTVYPKFVRPAHMRIVRTILETFREGDEGVRWYVMADDDTVLFVDNLVEVLAGYDHNKYQYIGASSESIQSDADLSFEMAFGGAGYALSYPLVEILVTKIDDCLERYPYSWVSDYLIFKCIDDLGVALTHQNGFHQIDLHNDISGLLSAHPQTPLLSLHHIDIIDPIFPSMNRSESINHLMEAAKMDHSRILQQTICYHRASNWSFSVAWGYSAHVYEQIHPRSVLHRPLESFRPWNMEAKPPLYVFNPRWHANDPCTAPHTFFFSSAHTNQTLITTTYKRLAPRGLAPCWSNLNNSADHIDKVTVYSPIHPLSKDGRAECCDVEYVGGGNVTEVKLRGCHKDEIIA